MVHIHDFLYETELNLKRETEKDLDLHFSRSILVKVLQQPFIVFLFFGIDHFTLPCLVAWPLNESEAGGDLVLIETSMLLLC